MIDRKVNMIDDLYINDGVSQPLVQGGNSVLSGLALLELKLNLIKMCGPYQGAFSFQPYTGSHRTMDIRQAVIAQHNYVVIAQNNGHQASRPVPTC